MTEQERAAELATKIEKLLPLGPFNRVTLNDDHAALVIDGLRLLAATPAASSEVRERVPRNTDWINEANEAARAQWPFSALAAAREPEK